MRKVDSLIVSETVFNLVDMQLQDANKGYDYYLDTFNNCRETGLCLGGLEKEWRTKIWCFEHRNSDDIVVICGVSDGNNMFDEEGYNNAKHFKFSQFYEASKYIVELINRIEEKEGK